MSTQLERTPTRIRSIRASYLETPKTPSSCAQQLAAVDNQPLTAEDEDLIAEALDNKLSGDEVSFPDGSKWQLEDALSAIKLHQGHSPSLARQTFAARCISDPLNAHGKWTEGVIKVDFQIMASNDTMQYYQDQLSGSAKSLKKHTEDRGRSREDIRRMLLALEKCREACKEPSDVTLSELFALRRFADMRCESAPCLLDFVETTVQDHYHFTAIKGGYMIFILMPKLRGITLSYQYLATLPPQERDEIRRAFSIALKNIWACGLNPTNCGPWNILWDKERKICCIVSFKDCVKIEEGSEKAREVTEDDIKRWSLNEELYEADATDSDCSD